MEVELTIVRGGGVAGVATRLHLVATTAGPTEEALVGAAAAALAAAPAVGAAPVRGADELRYAVRLGAGERRFTDSSLPEAVRALVAWADAHPGRRESLAPAP